MKTLVKSFLAAFFLVGGIASLKAEGVIDNSPENYRTYVASSIVSGSHTLTIKGGYLKSVIVSSPSASTLDIYNSSGGVNNKFVTIQLSTTDFTGPRVYDFSTFLSSGIHTVNTALGTIGAATVVYSDRPPNNAIVWQSTYGVVNTSTQTIVRGPVLLHAVYVLKRGVAAGSLRIYDQFTTSVDTNKKVAEIALNGLTNLTYDIMLSSGLTYNVDNAGTTTPEIILLYKVNPSRSFEYWASTFTSGTVTNRNIFAGRGLLGGVVNGSPSATSMLTVYDSSGTATRPLGLLIGSTNYTSLPYDVKLSSGLTVTNVGTGTYTIKYRRYWP